MNYIYYKTERDFLQALYSIDSQTGYSLLDFLFGIHWKYGTTCPSQTLIAHKLGVTRQTVSRWISRLCSLGLVRTCKRYNQTSIYTLTKWFWKCRSKINHLFTKLKEEPLSYSRRCLYEYVTSSKEKKDLKYLFSCIYNLHKKERRSSVRLYGSRRTDGLKINQEKRMDGSPVTRPTLDRAQYTTGATKLGRAKLSCFSEEALVYALEARQRFTNIRKPFEWLCRTAQEFSERNEIPLDWSPFYAAKSQDVAGGILSKPEKAIKPQPSDKKKDVGGQRHVEDKIVVRELDNEAEALNLINDALKLKRLHLGTQHTGISVFESVDRYIRGVDDQHKRDELRALLIQKVSELPIARGTA